MSSFEHPDAEVIVVGGGAMGSATTWQLARRGHEVMQLEQFERGHVRGSSHGRSRVFRLASLDPLYAGLARGALSEWRVLEAETGASLLTITGGVDHGHPSYLDAMANALHRTGIAFDELTPAQAERRWPGLRFDERVIYQPDAGRIDADRTIEALQDASSARGAIIRHKTPVRRLEVSDRGVTVRLDGETLRAPKVVVTAGAWASELLDGVVKLPRLTVTQQQPAHFRPRSESDRWPSFQHYGKRPRDFTGYGLSTPGEGVKVWVSGTGVPTDPDKRDFRPSEAGLARLLEYTKRWIPGVDPDTAEPISCLYTSTANNDFVFDRVGPVVVGAGCSGHAFKFTPIIGRISADLVEGRPIGISRFGLTGRRAVERTSTKEMETDA